MEPMCEIVDVLHASLVLWCINDVSASGGRWSLLSESMYDLHIEKYIKRYSPRLLSLYVTKRSNTVGQSQADTRAFGGRLPALQTYVSKENSRRESLLLSQLRTLCQQSNCWTTPAATNEMLY